ncbi:unnamed protein product [Larinioides sclopetarius]|uniref:Mitochondrial cytochrome c oxidase subunit VIc/VIIs domain-containing protein n=1 Tax=Larinioides sclopetarius TaxID=280406 RepID=A0AAV2ARJ1_9ARAC
MSSSKSKISVKKIRHGQLRGTDAAKFRHRIALGFTLSALAMSSVFGYLLSKSQPDPGESFKKLENPKRFVHRKGYKTFMEQEESKVESGSL